MFKIEQAIPAIFPVRSLTTGLPLTGLTIPYIVYDEARVSFDTGNATEIAGGLYYVSFTPDAAGIWAVELLKTAASPYVVGAQSFPVEMGMEADVESLQPTTGEFEIYILSEDFAAIELSDDGTSPQLTVESSTGVATEGGAEADPRWTEDWTLDALGVTNILSILFDLHWQMKISGVGTGYAKWQVSGDGGSNWVDVTTNLETIHTTYEEMAIVGAKSAISTITAGTSKLQMRLCAWTSATSVQVRIRNSSKMKITGRKSA